MNSLLKVSNELTALMLKRKKEPDTARNLN